MTTHRGAGQAGWLVRELGGPILGLAPGDRSRRRSTVGRVTTGPDDDLVPVSVRLGAVVPPEDPEDWTRPLTWVAALGMLAAPIVAVAWFVIAPPTGRARRPGDHLVAAALAGGRRADRRDAAGVGAGVDGDARRRPVRRAGRHRPGRGHGRRAAGRRHRRRWRRVARGRGGWQGSAAAAVAALIAGVGRAASATRGAADGRRRGVVLLVGWLMPGTPADRPLGLGPRRAGRRPGGRARRRRAAGRPAGIGRRRPGSAGGTGSRTGCATGRASRLRG